MIRYAVQFAVLFAVATQSVSLNVLGRRQSDMNYPIVRRVVSM